MAKFQLFMTKQNLFCSRAASPQFATLIVRKNVISNRFTHRQNNCQCCWHQQQQKAGCAAACPRPRPQARKAEGCTASSKSCRRYVSGSQNAATYESNALASATSQICSPSETKNMLLARAGEEAARERARSMRASSNLLALRSIP